MIKLITEVTILRLRYTERERERDKGTDRQIDRNRGSRRERERGRGGERQIDRKDKKKPQKVSKIKLNYSHGAWENFKFSLSRGGFSSHAEMALFCSTLTAVTNAIFKVDLYIDN